MSDVGNDRQTAELFRRMLTGSTDERLTAATWAFDLVREFGDENVPAVAGAMVVAFNAEQDREVRSQILSSVLEPSKHHRTVPRVVVEPLLALRAEDLLVGDYDLVEGIDECIRENEAAAERRSLGNG